MSVAALRSPLFLLIIWLIASGAPGKLLEARPTWPQRSLAQSFFASGGLDVRYVCGSTRELALLESF